MLVLRRRLKESLVIDGPATITVVEINGGQVLIGVEAEPATNVWREEILSPRMPQKERKPE